MLNDFGLAKSSNFEDDDDDSIIRFSPYKEEKLKEMMLSFIPPDFHPKFDQWFRLFVKEEIELSHQSKTIKHVSRNSELKNLELAISNVVSLLSTGDLIKGIGGVPVKVTLIDSHTKEVVKSGPEASGKVEIVVVEAEADNRVDDLKNILVLHKGQFEIASQERERKKSSCGGERRNRSVRVNKICLKLIEGTAVLPTVSFVREKKWMKISNLRLQARLADDFKGIQVKEAQTEPFTLKDRRIQASKKHMIPSLDDKVCQLDEVDKMGLLDRSLTEARIKPMGDYIDRLYLYPQHLEEISEGANDAKSLKPNVERARKYPADHALAKSEVITPSHESIILEGHDLQINEASLFGNVLPDGQYLNPQFLPEPLRTHYNKIYRDFESLCTSNQLEPEPGSKWVVTETSQRNRFCKIRRMIFCVVTFTKVLGDSHAHKKQRLS